MKKKLSVVDVTLRDGGCVNNFCFGESYISKILTAQEASGIDIIELGYIDENKGTVSGRTQYINDVVIPQHVLKRKNSGTMYVAMIDYGKFNIDNLQNRTEKSIDGIRIAFHKKNRYDMIPLAKKIIEKGYQLFVQPMITLRYSDKELLDLIDSVNKELPITFGFYIVDSFGEMRPNDMQRMMNLVDHNLNPSIALGFHSHNNLQMSYSNAMSMLQFPTNRDLMIDCSIMGMGKGAGNLNSELLLEHLNLYYGTHYVISPLLDVIDNVINQLHEEFYWGYSPEYYLSSANHCSPSYASHFYKKHMLPIDQVGELLSVLDEEKKISFDFNYAEKVYREYNERRTVDDSAVLSELTSEFEGKRILLIAPGKSIIRAESKLKELAEKQDVITIGLNCSLSFPFSYYLTTRMDFFEKVFAERKQIIVPSSVSQCSCNGVKILNYANWIEVTDRTHDSSSVIALRLLQACKVKHVMLAGFDGFSDRINDNYFDPNMRRPVNSEQAERRNIYYKNLIKKASDSGMSIQYVTPSLYQ